MRRRKKKKDSRCAATTMVRDRLERQGASGAWKDNRDAAGWDVAYESRGSIKEQIRSEEAKFSLSSTDPVGVESWRKRRALKVARHG